MTTYPLVALGNVCKVGDDTHSKIARVETGVPYLTARNFKDGTLNLSNVYYISEQNYEKCFLGRGKALAKPERGDLVFSIIGSLGEPYLIRATDRFGISSSVAIVRPDQNIIDPQFLFYWVKGPQFQNALFGIKGGVAQSYVSLEMIRRLPVAVAPLEIQRRIANILSAYDDLIEVNARRKAVLEEMAQRLFEEWFVKKIDPSGLPVGWNIVNLGDIATCKAGDNSMTKAAYTIEGYLAYSASGPDGHVPKYDYDRSGVVLSSVGANCGRTWLASGKWSCIANTQTICADEDKISDEYLYLATRGISGWTRRGSAQPFISINDVRSREILLPPKPVADQFSGLAKPIFRQLSILISANAVLSAARDLLLPKLMSGEIGLEWAERGVTTNRAAAE